MIWQKIWTLYVRRCTPSAFDSVLSARMVKGCAPDQAQRWAVQKKGVKEAGEETHLASQYWWTEDNLKPDMYIKMKSCVAL